MLNWVLFWPKNEWKPHSKTLSFSWYELCGAKIKFITKSNKAKIGINKKKNVILLILIVYFIVFSRLLKNFIPNKFIT